MHICYKNLVSDIEKSGLKDFRLRSFHCAWYMTYAFLFIHICNHICPLYQVAKRAITSEICENLPRFLIS